MKNKKESEKQNSPKKPKAKQKQEQQQPKKPQKSSILRNKIKNVYWNTAAKMTTST